MGYGLIKELGKKHDLLTMGVLNLEKLQDHHVKLQRIFQRTLQTIEEYHPDELAIEAPFFGKNVQSMLKLGRAQGVAIAAALSRDIPVIEYSPRKIKQSLTGNGNASKEQVASMVCRVLNTSERSLTLDATDGTAAAICHAFQKGGGKGEKKYQGWDAFLKENPHKRAE